MAETLVGPLREGCRLEAFRGGPIVVGVSGGADSVGLLHALVRADVLPPARPGADRSIIVAHAEHDLRGEAAADRAFVESLARELGLRCVSGAIACREEAARTGEGVEAAARRLRYAFLADTAAAAGARVVVVAHTADDQAETILHAILRGTGLAGLAGMPVARELVEGITLVRPLLEVDRSAVRDYLAAVGQPWREDATNADTRFARNFLRQTLLPAAIAGPYPAAQRSLRGLGSQAAMTASAMASAAGHILDTHSRRDRSGAVVFDPVPLGPLDPHLLAEVFVALWRRERWPRRDMSARHYRELATMLAAAHRDPGFSRASAVDLPGGVRAEIEADGRLRLFPAQFDATRE
jgi:tRNA(Ile)-lysidine synthase